MKKWIISIVILALVGAILAMKLRGNGEAYELTQTPVESGPITMTVETLGTIEPLSTVQISSETTGKIIELTVDHDDPVKKDQVICRIDPEVNNAQHAQSVAELSRSKSLLEEAKISREEQLANLPINTAQAKAQLDDAKANLEQAEFNWLRIDELFKNGDAPKAEWTAIKVQYQRGKVAVESAQAAYDLAKNNEKFMPQRLAQAVDQAEAALKLAQARFDTTEAQVKRCIITSPMDGIVLKRYLDVGTTVITTFQTPPLFMLAPSLERLRVNAKVSESDIVHIDVGQKAKFTVEGKQRSTFHGTIQHKRNQPDIIQNVVTYTVILEVNNDERHTLLPGMTVNIEIECVHKDKVAKVSNAALRFKPPLTIEERRAMLDELKWPPQPKVDTEGKNTLYCEQGSAWRFDEATHKWKIIPLWLGVTDNVETEILLGSQPGEEFVKKFIDKSSSGFSFKEAMKLANAENRTL